MYVYMYMYMYSRTEVRCRDVGVVPAVGLPCIVWLL